MSSDPRLFVYFLLLVLTIATLPVGGTPNDATPSRILAEQNDLEYTDLDDDNSPEILRIEFDFTEDGTTDQVIIYDRGEDMTRAGDWRNAVDYRNDLFVYDAESDGQPELVIDFQTKSDSFVAKLYDDHTDELSYQLDSDHFELEQPDSPALAVRSLEPWMENGQISYDLRLNVTDPVRSSFTWAQYKDITDRIETDINVSDVDDDGVPDYSIRQIRTNLPQSAGQVRTELTVNRGDEAVLSPNDGILWPYVGTEGGYTKPYGEASPPIKIDWDDGRVNMVGEFVASRGDEDNYFIYSIDRLSRQNALPLSFEYPFAFYDLAEDNDSRPESQVQMVYYPQGSRRGPGSYARKSPTTSGELRYSWDQDNDGEWEYKFGGIGTARYENITRLGSYRYPNPGYEVLPTWVSDQVWRSAVFVVRPDGFKSTEGIYEGDYNDEARQAALGLQSKEGRLFPNTAPGYRLEAADTYRKTPQLYYSPIDEQLHLHGMSYGYWNHSEGRVTYKDFDNDPYVDRWRRVSDGTNSSLYASEHGLIYTTRNRTVVNQGTVNESSFVTSVPTTTAEWKNLRKTIGTQPDTNRTDLRSIVNSTNGRLSEFPELTATKGTTTNSSVRVYATVEEELSYNGRSFEPETPIVLVLDSSGIEIYERTSPRLNISTVQITPKNAGPSDQRVVEATVTNKGWEDATEATLTIQVDGSVVKEQTVNIDGKQTKIVQMKWWPQSNVENASVVLSHRSSGDVTRIDVGIDPVNSNLFDRFTNGMMSVPAAVGLLVVVFLSVIITWRQLFYES